MTNDTNLTNLRNATVDAIINWAKSGTFELTMRSKVNEYMEATHSNRIPPSGNDGMIEQRRIQQRSQPKNPGIFSQYS